MKIKNKLNVLLIGGIALSSATYGDKTKLELVYLANVIQYLKTPGDLFNFLHVSRKCEDALKACQTNFIPVYDKKTYNLTHHQSEQATRSDYFSHHSGHAQLNENLDFIVHTPNFEGVLQGDIEITEFHRTKFHNAKILDAEGKQHKCGDFDLVVRSGELHIGQLAIELDELSLEEYISYTPNKTFLVHLHCLPKRYNCFLTGEITGEKTVKKIEKEGLPWYEITYKNAKIGHRAFKEVVLRVFVQFFCEQYNPDSNKPIRLTHIQSARNLESEKLKRNVYFIKEVCFGDLPDDSDPQNDNLTMHEKRICETIINNFYFDRTTLSFYLKSTFATREYWKKRHSPKQYKKIYNKSISDILKNVYGLNENVALRIEASKYKRIIVVEDSEGFIVSLPNALQDCQPIQSCQFIIETEDGFKGCQLITETEDGFKAHIPNISYKITEDCIKEFKDYFPAISEERMRELNENYILVGFPKEMVTCETGYRPWNDQTNVFIISYGNENLIIVGKKSYSEETDVVLIEIPRENVNEIFTGNIIYETKHTKDGLLLEWQPSPCIRHVMVFQMQ